MKIILASVGSRGDIQPYIAYAQELKKAGHEVALATLPWAADLLSFYQIPLMPVGSTVNLDAGIRDILDQSRNNRKGFFAALNFLFDTLRACHEDFMQVFADADLIVGHGVVGIPEAEMLGKPFIISSIEPMGLPTQPSDTGRVILDFMNNLPGRLLKAVFGRPYTRFRRDIGAPPIDFAREGKYPHRAILPVSKVVMAPRKNWKPETDIIGYFFSPVPEDFQPDPELDQFLKSRENIIFFSTGSMVHDEKENRRIVELILKATEQLELPAVVLLSGLKEKIGDIPDHIRLVESIPYPYILPHVSLVVHHFGFGTTAEVLKAGLPSVPVPHIFDQKIRAGDLYKKGLTRKALNLKKLTPGKLAEAVQDALGDQNLKARVQEAAQIIAGEGGVRLGVTLAEKYYADIREKINN